MSDNRPDTMVQVRLQFLWWTMWVLAALGVVGAFTYREWVGLPFMACLALIGGLIRLSAMTVIAGARGWRLAGSLLSIALFTVVGLALAVLTGLIYDGIV